MRQKVFDGKSWTPLLLSLTFFDTRNWWSTKGFPYEIFRHCETKKFRRKNMIPPFSSIKLFETRNFLKNSRIPLRNFSALWDIKISTENRDMPPLIHKFISIPKIVWKTEMFLYKAFCFGPVRQKISTKPWCPPSYAWKFSIPEFFRNTEVLWNILVQWDKNFSTENRDTSPPPLIHKIFSLPEKIFWNTEWFPGEIFRSCELKKFSTKPWSFVPPLLENFRYQNSFETQKCSPMNFIGTVRQKFFNGV